jgi:hypothetical protein
MAFTDGDRVLLIALLVLLFVERAVRVGRTLARGAWPRVWPAGRRGGEQEEEEEVEAMVTTRESAADNQK